MILCVLSTEIIGLAGQINCEWPHRPTATYLDWQVVGGLPWMATFKIENAWWGFRPADSAVVSGFTHPFGDLVPLWQVPLVAPAIRAASARRPSRWRARRLCMIGQNFEPSIHLHLIYRHQNLQPCHRSISKRFIGVTVCSYRPILQVIYRRLTWAIIQFWRVILRLQGWRLATQNVRNKFTLVPSFHGPILQ